MYRLLNANLVINSLFFIHDVFVFFSTINTAKKYPVPVPISFFLPWSYLPKRLKTESS